MEERLDELFDEIKNECLNIIEKENVNMDDLSFELGCDTKTLLSFLKKRNADFSIYLKLYDVLVDWQVKHETE
ncbi:MAG: hypothetical protein IKR57_00170 [Bacilli bacterium]|nr:hypothetical protein [Bacilli bacterium]